MNADMKVYQTISYMAQKFVSKNYFQHKKTNKKSICQTKKGVKLKNKFD